jgi:hypothetical protein
VHARVDEFYHLVEQGHGLIEAQEILKRNLFSKKYLADSKNFRLMVWYVRSGMPIDTFAAEIAKANKSLPWERRFGTGTTVAATMAKQIRRQIKKMASDERYRINIEEFVEAFPDVNIF